MKRIAPTLIAGALVSAGLLAGCDSQASLIANPGTQGNIPAISATLVTSPSAMLFFPQAGLTPEMKDAKSLQMLFGSTAIPMTAVASPAAGVIAPVPQTGGLSPDLEGKQRFTFILDRKKSQVVEVKIGS